MADTWPENFNPHDPEFLKNPYPTYKKFREQAPVCLVEPYKSLWVFSYADVKTMLEEKELFLKKSPEKPGLDQVVHGTIEVLGAAVREQTHFLQSLPRRQPAQIR